MIISKRKRKGWCKRFAWFPVKLTEGDNVDSYIWLEFYMRYQCTYGGYYAKECKK